MLLVRKKMPDFQTSSFYEQFNVRYDCNRKSYNTCVSPYRTNIKKVMSHMSRDSVVGIAIRDGPNGPGIDSQWA